MNFVDRSDAKMQVLEPLRREIIDFFQFGVVQYRRDWVDTARVWQPLQVTV